MERNYHKAFVDEIKINMEEKQQEDRELYNNNSMNELECKFNELFGIWEKEEDSIVIEKEEILIDNIVNLKDEDGNDVTVEFLDLIEYDGNEYVVFLPVDEKDGEVIILLVENIDNPDLESYVSIEDEEVLQAVLTIFKDKFNDELNFID